MFLTVLLVFRSISVRSAENSTQKGWFNKRRQTKSDGLLTVWLLFSFETRLNCCVIKFLTFSQLDAIWDREQKIWELVESWLELERRLSSSTNFEGLYGSFRWKMLSGRCREEEEMAGFGVEFLIEMFFVIAFENQTKSWRAISWKYSTTVEKTI